MPLPKRAKDGSLIIASKIRDCDVDLDPYESFKMYALMFKILVLVGTSRLPYESIIFKMPKYQGESLLQEDQLKSGKVVFIADCQHAKFSHIMKMTPQLVMTIVSVITNIFPYRISGMHVFGLPQAAEWMVTLMKSLVKPKLAERVRIYV